MISLKHLKSAVMVGACAAVLALPSPTALAGDDGYDDDYGMMGWGHHMGYGMHMGYGAVDLDGDETITADEAAAHAEKMFLVLDADESGDLSEEEFVERHHGWGHGWWSGRREARESARRERFATFDTDGDKVVSKAEFLAAAKDRFAAADTDNDGKVNPWEFRSQHGMY